MLTANTLERLRGHAGLKESNSVDIPFISECTWPRGRVNANLESSFADFISTLDDLNRELNGEFPPSSTSKASDIPRDVVYAVTEIIRMLRESLDDAESQREVTWFGRAVWFAEVAWSAVLSGDIDDIGRYLHEEEKMRFE